MAVGSYCDKDKVRKRQVEKSDEYVYECSVESVAIGMAWTSRKMLAF